METLSTKPYCAISVDVDSLYSLFRFHNVKPPRDDRNDPVYKKAVPRFLELFDEYGIRATFFVVAEDCANPYNEHIFRKISAKGHEIANHSLRHQFAFSMMSRESKEKDIMKSTELIKEICGHAPRGFRVPGYDVDEVTIDILDKMGYLYDSSVYKFSIYPIARRISYLRARLISGSDMFKNLPKELLQVLSAPARVYSPKRGEFWNKGEGRNILEMPLTITPLFHLPFNSTFLFLFGPKLFELGFWMVGKNHMDLNYNFHSTDMLSSDSDGISIRHPGMDRNLKDKQSLFRNILEKINRNYKCVTLATLARIIFRLDDAQVKKYEYTQ